jgi:hypothetical protein
MSDQEDPAINQDEARCSAADEAYRTARSSVLKYVAATGRVAERPVWPGAQSTASTAEPVAGIRAARVLADVAARVRGDYIRVAPGPAGSGSRSASRPGSPRPGPGRRLGCPRRRVPPSGLSPSGLSPSRLPPPGPARCRVFTSRRKVCHLRRNRAVAPAKRAL